MRYLDDSASDGKTPGETVRILLETADERSGKRHVASAPLTTFVPGDVVAKRFEVLHFLAQGGMGQVFEALDLELGISVALKVIRPDIANQEDAVRRFKNEVHLARQVTHPHVCRVYDLVPYRSTALRSWGGQGQLILMINMELLRGETLGQRLSRRAPFSPSEALPLISQMAAALDAAHEAGVVHRDFKSANVMLVRAGRRAVVTDFGLAEPFHESQSKIAERLRPTTSDPSKVSGTPAYVAPELVAGHEATTAVDVYSFGVVIYEMMTSRLPFRAETPEATARLRLEIDPPSPRQHRPELPTPWEAVILKCLNRDPKRRFARAGEIADALRASW